MARPARVECSEGCTGRGQVETGRFGKLLHAVNPRYAVLELASRDATSAQPARLFVAEGGRKDVRGGRKGHWAEAGRARGREEGQRGGVELGACSSGARLAARRGICEGRGCRGCVTHEEQESEKGETRWLRERAD